jgi:hypothetical protein
MRTLALTLPFVALLSPLAALADERDAVVAAARRQLELAQLKLRLYERDEHPRQLGQVERAIEMQRAKLESFRRRVREFEQFDKFEYSAPLFITLEDARLDVVAAELRLRELEDERFLLIRSRSDRARMMQLEIEAAAAQYNALVDAR